MTSLPAVYQGEIAHPSIRGRVTALQQFMLGIGAFVAGWISYGTFSLSGPEQWRIPLGIQLLPAVILAVLMLFFPESPRWLIDHGKEEAGLATLARLHADGDIDDPWVRAEFSQIQVTQPSPLYPPPPPPPGLSFLVPRSLGFPPLFC